MGGRILGAKDLQPVLPLTGNEDIYSKLTGISIPKQRRINK